MQTELFLILVGVFGFFFGLAYLTKQHGIGLIAGLELFVTGLFLYTDPLELKTGLTFSGVNQSIVTYDYAVIDGTLTGVLGLVVIGISIVVLYHEGLAIWKTK